MEGKFFWVLECDKYGPKPFYAMPDASWTWNKSDAQKFKDWDKAWNFRNNNPSLKEYSIRIYDFSDDLKFQDEQVWQDPEQSEMRF
jgi:hypothetical protein